MGPIVGRAADPPHSISGRPGYCGPGYWGGPASRRMRLVDCLPDGFVQPTKIVSPGRNRAMTRIRSSGDLTGCPLTAVMTAPLVRPARAAGLAQTTPRTRTP